MQGKMSSSTKAWAAMTSKYVVRLSGLVLLLCSGSCVDTSNTSSSKIVGLHMVLTNTTPNEINVRIRMAKMLGYNTVLLALRDEFTSIQHPCHRCDPTWTKDDFIRLKNSMDDMSMTLIPEVKLLTKVDKLPLDLSSDMLINRYTYNPQSTNVSAMIFDYLDEVIDVFNPTAIHIGHDELAGFNELSANVTGVKIEDALEADLFLTSVVSINKFLLSRNVKTWMWGDMLIAPDEFPSMLSLQLNGSKEGYGQRLRNRIPKSVVICDWHYFGRRKNYPSLAAFKQEGFSVLGVTWKDNKTTKRFAKFAKANDADGMIATTWWHVQKKEWDVVDDIIADSGQIFKEVFTK